MSVLSSAAMMETPLRRALGLYFVVVSLQYIPASLFMLGVENPVGPRWVLIAIPFAQGAIFAAAGMILFRSHDAQKQPTTSVVLPSSESIVQLFGVFFVARGLIALARPLAGFLFFNEIWSIGLGSELASAVASVLIGFVLLTWPRAITSLMKRPAD
jgi:hypothetical protein